METFGQKLKQAVELRGLPIDAVAQATGLKIEQIEALQRDDFSALPADEIIDRGLYSFAQLMEVDPDQVLSDFRHERQRGAPPPSDPLPPPHKARRGYGLIIAGMAILVAAIATVAFLPRASRATPSAPRTVAAQASAAAPTQPSAPERQSVEPGSPGVPASPSEAKASVTRPAPVVEPPKPETPVPPAASRAPRPAVAAPAEASGLKITEHGVGTGIAKHNLVGRTERFSEGERAWFWSRVEGGRPGEMISHVWIHDGVEELRVPIRLGSSRWRTHSYKMMNAGSAGSWIVEARDAAGWVLARREFSCSPRRNRN
jgi:cytoskeletal protein RodZ